MNQDPVSIKRALVSVSNKNGILEFARELVHLNIELISTGGTAQLLKKAQIATTEVSELTHFPEIMDGRVKTLHPKIHGGILGLRDQHKAIAEQQQIKWIDLVVVNLYPFAETIQKSGVTFDEVLEQIDIGGPTLIRAAAKNMGWATVIVDPADYEQILVELKHHQSLTFSMRQRLAAKAFAYTAAYDALIKQYLDTSKAEQEPALSSPSHRETSLNHFPEQFTFTLKKQADLRYGENPHQAASAYHFVPQPYGLLSAKQHQGKALSYNNLNDADAALACLREFTQPASVIVKHANPCAVALSNAIESAFEKAYAADPLSAFGGIIALNRACDQELAQKLSALFIEVLIAPEYSSAALTILAQKPQLRVLELNLVRPLAAQQELKFIDGGLLVQDKDISILKPEQLRVVTELQPEAEQLETMLFAWQVLKHLKSNAILIARDKVTVGIGTGQVSRIDAVEIALRKACPRMLESNAQANLFNAILASDAFFPFRDSIDRIAQFPRSKTEGVRAIIQPGGSVKDAEVIQACNEHGLAMVFTGQRCFKH